ASGFRMMLGSCGLRFMPHNRYTEAGERFCLIFNERHAELFNAFISNASLIDVPLGGFYDTFPHITGVVLEKGSPDHRPILLKEHSKNDGIVEVNGLISFKQKLQNLKHVISDWIATKKSESSKLKKDHLSRLSSIDFKIDQDNANDLDLLNRRVSIQILGDLDRLEASDLALKSWHQSILNDGEWIEDLDSVKDVFRERFRNRFQHTNGIQPTFDVDMLNHLSCDQSEFLERDFSREEIKRVVWDCGSDRAPGPDGFTFKFFTTFWDLLEADVIRFVQAFFLTRSIPKGCNSSFIALIPKVSNATIVTDFLPISLIGFQYKIIGKVLANL
ncbi:hypothetical protein Tco_0903412, partial [Tanacetum coccineum]